jgi:hypothetical protein
MIGVNKTTFIYYDLIGQTNKIHSKWVVIGLLEGLSKRRSIKCAIYFEECLKYLVTTGNNEIESIENSRFERVEDLNLMLFPIIRRIMTDLKLNINFNIYNMITDYFQYYENNIEKLHGYSIMDIEVNLCRNFSKYYIKKLNKNNK